VLDRQQMMQIGFDILLTQHIGLLAKVLGKFRYTADVRFYGSGTVVPLNQGMYGTKSEMSTKPD
jgi:hypothetical protein